jgi:DNA-binding protein HU-beta
MNKADLTEVLADRAGIPKVRAANYINILTEAIAEALLRDEKVTISDFGTFTVSQRRAFSGHNPKNGNVMNVPARRIPVFRSGKGLKGALNVGVDVGDDD